MNITPHRVSGNFNDFVYNMLSESEGVVCRVYSDKYGIPTMGVGYALAIRPNEISDWELRPDLDADLQKIDIALSDANRLMLQDVIEILNSKDADRVQQAKRLIPPYKSGENSAAVNVFDFLLEQNTTRDDPRTLFDIVIPVYEARLVSRVGATVRQRLEGSEEWAALLSLTYNAPALIGDKLVAALRGDDRVAAWYEIRYQSNAKRDPGLQTRRERESDLFSLYNTNVNDSDARDVIRFLEPKRVDIDGFLSSFESPRPIADLDNQIQPARSFLIKTYVNAPGLGTTIDGTVWVGTNGGDAISVSEKNDLVLAEGGVDGIDLGAGDDVGYGEAGKDTLFGAGGRDILFGGLDEDTLDGGQGSDTLWGGEGSDILDGGRDGDVDMLYGGPGVDIYRAFQGDIIDDLLDGGDNNGSVFFEGTKLSGGLQKEDNPDEYEGDGGTYRRNGSELIFEKGGMVLTIRNYQDDRLGIHLEPREPDPPPWPSAAQFVPRRDPLVLDLGGDGIATKGLVEAVRFDFDGNGFKERTGWVAPGEGMLMLDRNGDGRLTAGAELFGDFTPLASGLLSVNGFQALAQFDVNGDGKLDAQDPIWSQLKVWQFDPAYAGQMIDPDVWGKLNSLDELGITGIGLGSTITNLTDGAGNTEMRAGYFEWADGRQSRIAEYRFSRDLSDTVATDFIPVTAEIAELPNIWAYGNVYSLQQAMVRDASGKLKGLVEAFVAEGDAGKRSGLFEQILFKWTGVDGVAPNSRGAFMDARRIGALERLYGERRGNPDQNLAVLWQQTYRQVFETLYSSLAAKSHLKGLFDGITYTFDAQAQRFKGDLTGVIGEVQGLIAADPAQGRAVLSEFARAVRGLGLQEKVDYLSFREAFIQQDPGLGWVIDAGGLPVYEHLHQGQRAWSPHIEGTDSDDAVKGSLTEGDGYLNGLMGDDVIYGTARNEVLINETGNATLVAGGGNDQIWAGAGADLLDGGTGNDRLVGETGNDTYIFRRGSGQDTVLDTDATAGNTDRIWMGRDIAPADVAAWRMGNDLVLAISGSADRLTVQDYFKNNSFLNRIERIEFSDGTVWSDTDIIRKFDSPSEADDTFYGSIGDDNLRGLGGNDTLYGQKGNDTLRGDADNDRLYGEEGEDRLDGGSGNDTLDGGLGNDTYLFGRGSGQDTLFDDDMAPGNADVVILGDDVQPSDVEVYRIDNDVKLAITDTQDSLTIKNFFLKDDPRYLVERIQFADGTAWGVSDIVAKSFHPTAGDDVLFGYTTPDRMEGLEDNDKLYGRSGDDSLNGGLGNDTLYGEAGHDTLQGGEGVDELFGGQGDDILNGGPGSDLLYGGEFSVYSSVYNMPDAASGNDTYVFGRGSGQDTIFDRDGTAGNMDTILLGSEILPSDVSLRNLNDSLKISLNGSADELSVMNWFKDESGSYQVERIRFEDGTTWDATKIKERVLQGTPNSDILIGYSSSDTIQGVDGGDVLYGRAGDDTIDGGSGNDRVYGESGDDSVLGGSGDDWISGGSGRDRLQGGEGGDVISGGEGDDTLDGGAGNDRLIGEEGSDTYLFGRGFGQDVIVDTGLNAQDADAILLADEIAPSDIQARRQGDDLVLLINDTLDTMTVQGWFQNEPITSQVKAIRFADGTAWDVAAVKQMVLQGTPGDDLLVGYSSADLLDGGAGNDQLRGKSGNDLYVFGRGYGQDSVSDYDGSPGNVDTLLLSGDIAPSDVSLKRTGDNLHLLVSGTGDLLTLSNWFSGEGYKVEQIQFADGTLWDVATMEALAYRPTDSDDIIYGTPAADVIDAGGGNDRIYAQEGDDTLYGGPGNDYLYGREDNDKLYGGEGNDWIYSGLGVNELDGGPGNDRLYATEGENTYHVQRGGGFDFIEVKRDFDSAEEDTIIFGEGIAPEDISVQIRDGGHYAQIAIGIGEEEGALIMGDEYGWNYGGAAKVGDLAVKRFVFADGTVLTLEEILARADEGVIGWQYGTDGDDSLMGSVAMDYISGYAGHDRIEGRDNDDYLSGDDGDDTVSGGSGQDYIYSGDGDDVLAGGKGNDNLTDWQGSDVYAFNRGDGSDWIDAYRDTESDDVDVLSFGSNIKPEDIDGYADSDGNLVLTIRGTSDRITAPWFDPYNDYTANDWQALSRIQFIQPDASGRVFDLTAIIAMLKDSLLAAAPEAPVALFTPETAQFELTGAPLAGGDYAIAYAQTGDLFAVPTHYSGGYGDDFITARAGDDTIDAGEGDNVVNAGEGNNRITAGSGDDRVVAGGGNDSISAGDGDNAIFAGVGNDVIFAGTGSDLVEAGDGNDLLSTGPGDDVLSGGAGDDTYYFNAGDGTLTVNDLADGSGGNRIVFGHNITSDDLNFKADGSTLVIEIGATGDNIRLNNFVPADVYGPHAVERYDFDDGTALTYEQLIAKGFDLTGTLTDDALTGTSAADRIAGLGGDDRLAGGLGNDLLDGGSGHDTYVFNMGDGIDTIRDEAYGTFGNVLEFGPSISLSDLSLSFDQNGLFIQVGSEGDGIRFEGFDPSNALGPHPVETFSFANGSSLSFSELLELGFTINGTPGVDDLRGTSAGDVINGMAGNDLLRGGSGDDTYRFRMGDGIDTIEDQASLLEPNTIGFGPGVTPEDIRFDHDPVSKTLNIRTGNSGDEVRLAGFDATDPHGSHAVEYFQFAGGEILAYNQLIDLGFDIEGGAGDDTLTGTAAADRITGKEGADTLQGNAGNDTLPGGAGDDTYLFNLGDGVDVIEDVATASEGNTLVFGEGITLEGLRNRLTFQDNTLVIRAGDQGDEVHLTGFDPNAADTGPRAVQSFRFSDGTLVNYEGLVQNTFIIQGDTSDDALTGTNLTDRLYGYEGFDRLEGGAGDDTLTGGTGDDELFGGAGNETYVFNLGDGVDTIHDTATAREGNLILLGEGISRDDLSISRIGSVLTIHVGTSGDAIRLQGFDESGENGSLVARTIEFADGSRMQTLELLGTEGDDAITTGAGDDAVDGRGGNDLIRTGDGSDILIGGKGNDTLIGGPHDDTYIYNEGDGIDTIQDQAAPGEGNRIVFGATLVPADIVLGYEGANLLIRVGHGEDRIVLPNFNPDDAGTARVIEGFEFGNATEISYGELVMRGFDLTGTEADDLLIGTNLNDRISDQGGNDILYGGQGEDVLAGAEGNDSLYGGPGNDLLRGGGGDDVFHFERGDGVDAIDDTGGVDTLVMGAGIAPETLVVSPDGNDLLLVGAEGGTVRLKDWAMPENRVENIRFQDGASLAIGSFLVPRVEDYTLSLPEDGSAAGTIEAQDAFGPLGFGIKQGSAFGDFTLNPDGTWEYRPAQNYFGTDRAVVEVTNQWGRSADAAIELTILPVNDDPIAPVSQTHILEDVRTFSARLEATDPDGDALSYLVSQSPQHGVLSIGPDGTWTYEAEALYMGGDQGVIRVYDENGGAAATQLNFDIRGASHLPERFEFSLDEDAAISGVLPIVGSGEFVCTVTQASLHGTFSIDNDGSFTYTPHPDYNGNDRATVAVTNPYGLIGSTIMDFTVQPVNDSPVVKESESFTLFGVSSLAGRIEATDADGDALSYKVVQGPGNGTFSLDGDGCWIYSPTRGYTGREQTVIAVEDGQGGVVSSTLNFAVNVYEGGDQVVKGSCTSSIALLAVSKDDLELTRQSLDLHIAIRGKGSLTLEGYFAAPENGVERLETLEGPLHLAKDVIKDALSVTRTWRYSGALYGENGVGNLLYGSTSADALFGAAAGDVLFGGGGSNYLDGKEGDDTLVGSAGYDMMLGRGGDDTIYGGQGADLVFAGEGDDVIVGGADSDYLNGDGGNDRLFSDSGNDLLDAGSGRDTLTGGKGNDTLLGGTGDDIYRFNPGDGKDEIKDSPECWFGPQEDGGNDTVQFAEGVSKEDVAVFMSRGNLYLQYGKEDVVEVYNQAWDHDKIERFELADGSYLTDADVNRVIQEMSSYAVNEGMCLQSVGDVRRNDELMTLIASTWKQS